MTKAKWQDVMAFAIWYTIESGAVLDHLSQLEINTHIQWSDMVIYYNNKFCVCIGLPVLSHVVLLAFCSDLSLVHFPLIYLDAFLLRCYFTRWKAAAWCWFNFRCNWGLWWLNVSCLRSNRARNKIKWLLFTELLDPSTIYGNDYCYCMYNACT